MKIYTKSIQAFCFKCEEYLKEIIARECGIDVRRSRFLITGYTYPIHIVAIESKNQLGYFDPHTYQIGINIQLMYQAKEEILKNILRHEFAHYMCFIESKNLDNPHGEIFKNICSRYGWNELVSKAQIDIQLANDNIEGNLAQEKLMRKVKALLNLANSDNQNEAELATIKANDLILKYNIQHIEQESPLYTQTVVSAKRKNAKLSCIYDILKFFLVRPILIYGKGEVFLEVSGKKESIELSKYVSDFLETELERLWKNQTQLKGLRAKNSFFMGISKGYQEKMEGLRSDYTDSQTKTLIKIEKSLDDDIKNIYRRLSYTTQQNKKDTSAFRQGQKDGRNLTIQETLKHKTKNILKLNWRQT